MNLYVFFIILFVIGFLTMMWLSKRLDEHLDKAFWVFWIIWFVAMQISVQAVCGVNTVRNRKLEEVKTISGTFVSKHREKSKLEELLGEDEEEYYSFITEDGKQYEIGESSIIGTIPGNVHKVKIYQADTYEGYRYFYLLRKKKDHLYEFIE